MRLKKFADYNKDFNNQEETAIVNDYNVSTDDIKPSNDNDVEETTNENVEETTNENVEETTNENVEETANEEVLLKPEDKDLPVIEILEENVIKFNSGHINEILETIKTKYSDTDYFLRKKDNQLHIVKYNEQRTLNVNNFVNTLLKFYSTNKENNNIIKNIKVKGNHSFSIIENMNPRFINKFVSDISKLLANKKD